MLNWRSWHGVCCIEFTMKKINQKLTTTLTFVAALALMTGCDVDQTQEGELPDVDIDVQEGALPAYDVDVVDVDVGMKTKTVEVPKVAVYFEEEEVEVPYIDATWPNEERYKQRKDVTITAKAVVLNQNHELKIAEVYVAGDELIVISKIVTVARGGVSGREFPVQDTIVVKAPNLDVNHYLITDIEGIDSDDLEIIRMKTDIDIDWDNARSLFTAK